MRWPFYTNYLVVILLIITSRTVYAQDSDHEVASILQRVIALTATFHQNNYTIAHIEVGKLSTKQIYVKTRRLHAGNTYRIVGVGGTGIKDLDIYIHDQDNNLVGKDNSSDNFPMIDLRPSESGEFKIASAIYALEKGMSADHEYFFCFVIAYKRERNFSVTRNPGFTGLHDEKTSGFSNGLAFSCGYSLGKIAQIPVAEYSDFGVRYGEIRDLILETKMNTIVAELQAVLKPFRLHLGSHLGLHTEAMERRTSFTPSGQFSDAGSYTDPIISYHPYVGLSIIPFSLWRTIYPSAGFEKGKMGFKTSSGQYVTHSYETEAIHLNLLCAIEGLYIEVKYRKFLDSNFFDNHIVFSLGVNML